MRQSVLIVDDSPENIVLLEAVLRADCDSYSAEDGERGLALARERKPDLILLDVMLPGMDGYDVCRALKDDPDLCDVPVIFITALDALEKETRGLDLGAVDYITKPFNLAITRLRIRNHLQLKAQRDLLERRTAELQEALKTVKQLSGLLPICAWCKKIRDDQGSWSQMEAYIREHSEADFSHGVCPDCLKSMMPDD